MKLPKFPSDASGIRTRDHSIVSLTTEAPRPRLRVIIIISVCRQSRGSSDMSDAPITVQEYIEVKRALAESQCQVKVLIQTNQDLKQEITLLHNMVGPIISFTNCSHTYLFILFCNYFISSIFFLRICLHL